MQQISNKENPNTALDEMLKSYRATPHPATGTPPGCMMFRGGYRSGFPRFNITEESKLAGHEMDSDKRKERKEETNDSNK